MTTFIVKSSHYLTHKETYVLGRETAFQKIEWINGWPRRIQGDCISLVVVESPAEMAR